jgi:hypothetical protein
MAKYTLYGDGIHDDYLGIQELLDSGISTVELPIPEINLSDFAKGLELPPIHASEALPPNVSNVSNSNTSVDTRINEIKVYTQATDANAIAKDIGGAIDNNWTAQANVGIAG